MNETSLITKLQNSVEMRSVFWQSKQPLHIIILESMLNILESYTIFSIVQWINSFKKTKKTKTKKQFTKKFLNSWKIIKS